MESFHNNKITHVILHTRSRAPDSEIFRFIYSEGTEVKGVKISCQWNGISSLENCLTIIKLFVPRNRTVISFFILQTYYFIVFEVFNLRTLRVLRINDLRARYVQYELHLIHIVLCVQE